MSMLNKAHHLILTCFCLTARLYTSQLMDMWGTVAFLLLFCL